MSLTFKLLSLAIRTAAKPIGNYIKKQAKEHDGFRVFAVNAAQGVHRIDMRMRLGILHDTAAQDRMHEREQRAAEEKRRKAETPTVRSETDQKKFDEEREKEATKDDSSDAKKDKDADAKKAPKIKIRPLSEARAIELGANFFSEAFIFGVAAGLLIWDSWRSRSKESARRDDVAERLLQLEAEVEGLRGKLDPDLESLEDLSQRIKATKKAKEAKWWNPLTWWGAREEGDAAVMEEGRDAGPLPEKEERIVPTRKGAVVMKGEALTGVVTPVVPSSVAADNKDVRTNSGAATHAEAAQPATRLDSINATNKGR